MPTITVSDNITFQYVDSGHIDDVDYTTCIIVHGHSFHSGVFQRLFPFAKAQSLRLICVNRRAYPGSTPYSDEELEQLNSGDSQKQAIFLQKQGVILSLFVDGIIQKYALPQKGGVALVAWSMGNLFAVCALSALPHLPPDVRSRLVSYVRSYVAWDPPSVAFGIAEPQGSFVPLWSDSIPVEERGRAFGGWISGYFTHGGLASKEYAQLNQHNLDPNRPPTVATMTPDEIQQATAIPAGIEFDTPLVKPGEFESSVMKLTENVFFDSEARKEWTRLKICVLYGESSAWVVIYGVWMLEKLGAGADIQFRAVPDANHFLMWDNAELSATVLKECTS